jgi:DNA-binding CsgD family transcriptional regulator
MGRRGRRPHPDILTPREWEVLALLRERLTNEQIAERLGITLDGAKYHVSEILSKLGLGSRHEAASWQPEVAKPWWQRLVSLPLAARIAAAGTLLAAAAGLAMLAWGVIQTNSADEPVNTVAGVYSRMSDALAEDGMVYHAVVPLSGQGPDHVDAQWEYWLDAANDRIRWFNDPETALIVAEDEYTQDSCNTVEDCAGTTGRDEAATCPNLNHALSFLPGICSPIFPAETRLEQGEYSGASALVLTTEGTYSTDTPDQFPFSFSFYVDPESFLPIAFSMEYGGTGDQGTETTTTSGTFEGQFIELGSLPDDFFDPVSIGYDRS